MHDLRSTNVLLEKTCSRPNATRNRTGDLYLFEDGLEEYIGSLDLLSNLKFYIVGESVPKETTHMKIIEDVLSSEQIDDLYDYIPYIAHGKLVVPIPVSQSRADSLGYKHYNWMTTDRPVLPDVFEMNNGILCTITSLFDGENPNVMLTIYSYWTYVNESILPAIVNIPSNPRENNLLK
jgi:hypothetical protein